MGGRGGGSSKLSNNPSDYLGSFRDSNPRLSAKELDAIETYTVGTTSLNKDLRNGEIGAHGELVPVLDDIMAKSTVLSDTTLFRGGNLSDMGISVRSNESFWTPKDPADVKAELMGMKTWTDKGYLSTSMSKSAIKYFTGDTTFTILAPKGTQALNVSRHRSGSKEREVLMARNTRYEIVDVKYTKDKGSPWYNYEVILRATPK